jgi:hypothetical protein
MAQAIADYGVPFMRSLVDIHDLCDAIKARPGLDHVLTYRRPIVCLLAGHPDQARRALEETVANLGNQSNPAADDLRRYPEALGRRLDDLAHG